MDRETSMRLATLRREGGRSVRRSIETALGLADEGLSPALATVDSTWPGLDDAERLRLARLTARQLSQLAEEAAPHSQVRHVHVCDLCGRSETPRAAELQRGHVLVKIPLDSADPQRACQSCLGRAMALVGPPAPAGRCSTCGQPAVQIWPPSPIVPPTCVGACAAHLRSALKIVVTQGS